MAEPTCRGSIALGSGCRQCARCQEEMARIYAPKEVEKLKAERDAARAEVERLRAERGIRHCPDCNEHLINGYGAVVMQENIRLREALEFYADASNYIGNSIVSSTGAYYEGVPVRDDEGAKARAALATNCSGATAEPESTKGGA